MIADSRKLRILMVAPTSFFSDYGCHVRILEEIRALQNRGHIIRLCTYHNGNNIEGIDIRRSIDVPWRKRVVVGSSRHKLYLDVVLTLEVTRQITLFRPDVIHAHLHEGALIGGLLGRVTRTPTVFDYQGSLTREMIDHGFLTNRSFLARLVRMGESLIEGLPSRIITSSDIARRQLLDHYDASSLVHTVLDAVDTTQFNPARVTHDEQNRLRTLYGIPDDSSVVVYLGLLAPYQGSDLLLSAVHKIINKNPRTFFLIMGFPGNERYRRMADDYGIGKHLSFPGRIPYQEAAAHLALGDVAVAPKMSLTEGNGKIYNYMAMGKPVVAFDAPANREILGELGVYAEFGSADDLARKIDTLLRDPLQAAELGHKLRQRAELTLSWRDRVHEILAVYEQLVPDFTFIRPGISNRSAKAQARELVGTSR